MQYQTVFDESVLTPVTLPSPNPLSNRVDFDIHESTFNSLSTGNNYIMNNGVIVSWISNMLNPITYSNLTLIYSIPFIVVGNIGDITTVNIDCNNYTCEIIPSNSGVIHDFPSNPAIIDIGGTNNCIIPCDASNGTLINIE